MNKENIITGFSNPDQFRDENGYVTTEELFLQQGLSPAVENRTPPVCVNIAHLAGMDAIHQLSREFSGKPVQVTFLGLSSARGPKDLQDLLKNLGATQVSTTAIDISDGIFSAVTESGLDNVICLERDAQKSGLAAKSQDLVFRDHLGNCCPPEIDSHQQRS